MNRAELAAQLQRVTFEDVQLTVVAFASANPPRGEWLQFVTLCGNVVNAEVAKLTASAASAMPAAPLPSRPPVEPTAVTDPEEEALPRQSRPRPSERAALKVDSGEPTIKVNSPQPGAER